MMIYSQHIGTISNEFTAMSVSNIKRCLLNNVQNIDLGN